jgi:IS30 family transposase
VLSRLAQGWSPEQVTGRLRRVGGTQVISHETIYRFIYAQLARTKDYSWRQYLPRDKSKRGWRGRKSGSPASFIALRPPISERPEEANDRKTPGHWEGDLMLFGVHKQPVLTLHERHSHLLIAARRPSKHADPIAKIIGKILALCPPRGARHSPSTTAPSSHGIISSTPSGSILPRKDCDTHSPWQKGGGENAIGRMRRTLPRKTNLAAVTNQQSVELLRAYDNTPRKCLGFLTPAEVFRDQVLHFKCESTFQPSQE